MAASWASPFPEFSLTQSVLDTLCDKQHTVSSGHVTYTVIAVDSLYIRCKLTNLFQVLGLPQCVTTVPAYSPNIS